MRFLDALLAPPRTKGEHGTLVGRIVLAYLWFESSVPRWTALLEGHAEANPVAVFLFGKDLGFPITYFATLLETVGCASLILGLFTRLAAFWSVVEFAITGAVGLALASSRPGRTSGGLGLLTDFGLMATSLALMLNGSSVLSIDRLIAKRKGLAVAPSGVFEIIPEGVTIRTRKVVEDVKRLTHTKTRSAKC